MKLDIKITGVSVNEAQEILAKLAGTNVTTHINSPQTFTQPPVAGAGSAPQNFAPAANTVDEGGAPAGNVAGQFDTDGLPWDARIHSSNQKKKADGRWVSRRNVDEALYNQVVNELRAGGTPPAAPVPAFLQSMQPGHVPAAPMNPLPPQQPTSYAPAAPAMPAYAPQPPVAAPGGDINALFAKISQMFQAGTADAPYMNSLTQRLSQTFQVQVNSVNDIAGRPDIIAYAFQIIAADGK